MLSTSDKITAYRHKRGMTQEQVTLHLDMTPATYRTREAKPLTWKLGELIKLSGLFGVEVKELMGDDEIAEQ